MRANVKSSEEVPDIIAARWEQAEEVLFKSRI